MALARAAACSQRRLFVTVRTTRNEEEAMRLIACDDLMLSLLARDLQTFEVEIQPLISGVFDRLNVRASMLNYHGI